MGHRSTLAGLACAVAALAVAAPAAAATDPTPGCDVPLVSDWDFDAVVDPSGGLGVGSHAGPENMDIESGNLRWVSGQDGTGHLVADIQIYALDKSTMDPKDSQGGNYYYLFFTSPDGVQHFVKAVNNAVTGITYSYGHIQEIPNAFSVYQTDGTTTGAFGDGPDGHVVIDVPALDGVTEGTALTDVFVNADALQGYDDFVGLNSHVDTAPDGIDTVTPGGPGWTVAACPGATA